MELRRLEGLVRKRRMLVRGERLFRTGDPLSALFIAREGAFKTVCLSLEGEEQVLGFHLAGELIGLDALGESVHRCEGVALTTANVCEIPFKQLSKVVAELPGLQQQLLRVIGQSVDRDRDHAGMLVCRHANERIALFLHGLSKRYRQVGHPGTQFRLPMSREEIAHFLGLALETVSRGFTRLQEDGVISVAGRNIEILSVRELMRLAHAVMDEGRLQQRA